MEVATPECYADSPFVDSIAIVSMPKGFTTPTMTYDGTEDPLEHINQYKQKMMVVAATEPEKEACMCKGFGSTLSGAALQWFVNLPNKSISSFAGLETFLISSLPAVASQKNYPVIYTGSTRGSRSPPGIISLDSMWKKYLSLEKKNEIAKPYNKNTVNKVLGETESTEAPPKLSENGFSTGLARVLKAIRELGQRARWPKKPTLRENDRRDAIKRCEYHNDIGHNTEDYVVLRKEVKHLYTAKRHATETKGDKPEFSLRVSRQDLPAITFDEADIPDEVEHHHDALIITLSIGKCLIKKIFVDTGSSVNLIMLETLKNMGFNEKDLVQKAVPLVGFSGETKQSLGEIVIPTFAEGMNSHVRSHSDMIGIDPSVITHWLNVDPSFPPVQQKRRKFAPGRNEVINQEVDNLLTAGKIREVNYPE
ncbi:uncharacterized protein LOC141630772 [Silene latifolia]|uniref:uncharacterized protein LOC141630772 n=1 Tax=Silene latifolia TaxID=37657 RepID=UPI003D77F6B8